METFVLAALAATNDSEPPLLSTAGQVPDEATQQGDDR